MDISNFAFPSDDPSVYYLSNKNNISLDRQALLEATLNRKKLTVVSKLIDYLKINPDSYDNYLFAIHLLVQLIRLDKKDPPAFLRYASAIGEVSEKDKKLLLPYLEQIKHSLNNTPLPSIEIEVEQLAMEKYNSFLTSPSDKEAIVRQIRAEIYLDKGYFYSAYQEIDRALARKKKDKKVLISLLKKVWPMLEAQRLGILLKIRDTPISTEEEQLLKLSKPLLIVPAILEDENMFSTKYLRNVEFFTPQKRGIVYQLFHRDYNGSFYGLKQMIATLDTDPLEEDLLFLIAVAEQLAKICKLPPTGFVTAILDDKESVIKWKTDIKLYFETVHTFLLIKSLPNIHEQAHEKAKNLTNKLRKKQDATWTPDEWQSTYFRAKAWFYANNKYYQATYQAALAAEALSDLGAKDVASYKRKYKKFVHAEELGRRLASYHQKDSKGKNHNKFRYAFQMSVTPKLNKNDNTTILQQLDIDLASLNEKIADSSKHYIGELDISSPDTIVFIEANESFINLVIPKLDKQIVRNLILKNCKIEHDLPAEIFQLGALRQLRVNGGELSHISENLGNLVQLNNIYLSDLTHLKSLPINIGSLTKLTHLTLYLNNLTTLPPLSNCQNLKRLLIHNSQIKIFPESICQLTDIEYLSLSHNQLSQIPASIQNLQKLQSLKLANNPWISLPKTILELPKLKEFELKKEDLAKAQITVELKAALIDKAETSQKHRRELDDFYKNIGK